MENDDKLLAEIAEIFKEQGVEVIFMQAPTDFDKEGKVIAAASIRLEEDYQDEIKSMIIDENIETAYLYKAGWLEFTENKKLPYFRMGKN